MPLPEDDWAKGKCGGKARIYMAAAVPAVVTAIGYNHELIQHGETGMLVRTEDDWFAALHALSRDPGLRARIGNAGREHVEQNLSLERIGQQLIDLLHDVTRA